MDSNLAKAVIEASKQNPPAYKKGTSAQKVIDYYKYHANKKGFYPDFVNKYPSTKPRLEARQHDRFCRYNNILNDPIGLLLLRAGIDPLGAWSYGSVLANSKSFANVKQRITY